MTLAAFVVIALLGFCCGAMKWRRTSRTLYVMSGALFLAVGCGPIPAWLLNDLQSPYTAKTSVRWGKQNAIILLGAGTVRVADKVEPGPFSYARIIETVALYDDCRRSTAACQIIITGADASRNGSAEATVYQQVLLRVGVNAADVTLEPDSMNTWQNAQFTCAILKDQGPDRVVLVSSGFHLQRSTLYFAHFGIATTPSRADHLHVIWSVLPLAYNFALTDFALQEYIGIARYHAYTLLGWNPAANQGC